MEWKEAIGQIRKELCRVGKEHGFKSIGHKCFQREMGIWRAQISYEATSLKRGTIRKLWVFPSLKRSEDVSERENSKLRPGHMANYISYEVFRLTYPVTFKEFDSPDALSAHAEVLGRTFELMWMPWFEEKSKLGPYQPEMRSYLEQVDKRLDYVP